MKLLVVFLLLVLAVAKLSCGLFVHVEEVYDVQISSPYSPSVQLYFRDGATDSRFNSAQGIPHKTNLVFDLRAVPDGTYRVLPLLKIIGMTATGDTGSSVSLYSNTTSATTFPPTTVTPVHKTWAAPLPSNIYFSGTNVHLVQRFFSPTTNGQNPLKLSTDSVLVTLNSYSTKFITLYIDHVGNGNGAFANVDLYGLVLTLET